MSRDIDALTSPALKHVRDRWWDSGFTEFLRETLQPRHGKRWLDVGCGMGIAELQLGALGLDAVSLVGVDVAEHRVRHASAIARSHEVSARFLAADAVALPFVDGAFDATFCVAVLQHIDRPERALAEFARVTQPGGRVVAVEPDNASRQFFSALESGTAAFEAARAFFTANDPHALDVEAAAIGPHLPGLMIDLGLEPVALRLFPVSLTRIGAPSSTAWEARRRSAERLVDTASPEVRRGDGHRYLEALARYEREAQAAGPRFVEIQHTMLYAVVAQRPAHER